MDCGLVAVKGQKRAGKFRELVNDQRKHKVRIHELHD